jgi:hypothetical protein
LQRKNESSASELSRDFCGQVQPAADRVQLAERDRQIFQQIERDVEQRIEGHRGAIVVWVGFSESWSG